MREQSLKAWKRWPMSLTAAAAVGFLALAAPAWLALPASSPETVACRVLEANSTKRYGVTLIVFHHRDQNDRARLAALLGQHAGGYVEFQTADGTWHPAIVLRLKSCFGRGLLVFPFGAAHLTEKDEFVLRWSPSHRKEPGNSPGPAAGQGAR